MKERAKKWLAKLIFFVAIIMVSAFGGYVWGWVYNEKNLEFAIVSGLLVASLFGCAILGSLHSSLRSATASLLENEKERHPDDQRTIEKNPTLTKLAEQIRGWRQLESKINDLVRKNNSRPFPILNWTGGSESDFVCRLFEELDVIMYLVGKAGLAIKPGELPSVALQRLLNKREAEVRAIGNELQRLGPMVQQGPYLETIRLAVTGYLTTYQKLSEEKEQHQTTLRWAMAAEDRNSILLGHRLNPACALLTEIAHSIWSSRGARGKSFVLPFQEATVLRRHCGFEAIRSLAELPEDLQSRRLLDWDDPELLAETIDRSNLPEGDPITIALRQRVQTLRG